MTRLTESRPEAAGWPREMSRYCHLQFSGSSNMQIAKSFSVRVTSPQRYLELRQVMLRNSLLMHQYTSRTIHRQAVTERRHSKDRAGQTQSKADNSLSTGIGQKHSWRYLSWGGMRAASIGLKAEWYYNPITLPLWMLGFHQKRHFAAPQWNGALTLPLSRI